MKNLQIRIYEMLQSKFSKEGSETLVSEIRNLQGLSLIDKIDARVSRAESKIVNNKQVQVTSATFRLLIYKRDF